MNDPFLGFNGEIGFQIPFPKTINENKYLNKTEIE